MNYLNYILCIIIVILIIGIIILLCRNRKMINMYKKEIEKIAAGDITLEFEKKSFGINNFSKISEMLLVWIYRVLKSSTRMEDELKEVTNSCEVSMNTAKKINIKFSEFDDKSQEVFHSVNKMIDVSEDIYESHNELYILSNKIAEIADQVEDNIEYGNNTLKSAIGNLEEINLHTENFKSYTGNLLGITDKVNDMAQLINSLSSNINLLSLNAAIEAARAGESGKGFAVVAEEIGKLADESSVYAGDIKRNIDSIDDKIDEIINAINILSQNQREAEKSTGSIEAYFKKINIQISEIINEMQKFFEKIEASLSSNKQIKSISEEVKEFFKTFMNEMKIIDESIVCQYEFEKLNVDSCNEMKEAISYMNIITKEFDDIISQKLLKHCEKLGERFTKEKISNEKLKEYGIKNGISEINISNSQGIIEYSNHDIIGYEWSKDKNKQSYEFRRILDDNKVVIAQKFAKRDLDEKYYKYVASSRKDGKGILQMGLDIEDILKLNI